MAYRDAFNAEDGGRQDAQYQNVWDTAQQGGFSMAPMYGANVEEQEVAQSKVQGTPMSHNTEMTQPPYPPNYNYFPMNPSYAHAGLNQSWLYAPLPISQPAQLSVPATQLNVPATQPQPVLSPAFFTSCWDSAAAASPSCSQVYSPHNPHTPISASSSSSYHLQTPASSEYSPSPSAAFGGFAGQVPNEQILYDHEMQIDEAHEGISSGPQTKGRGGSKKPPKSYGRPTVAWAEYHVSMKGQCSVPCPVSGCPKIFVEKRIATRHILSSTSQDHIDFKNSWKFSAGTGADRGDDVEERTCLGCQKVYSRPDALARHHKRAAACGMAGGNNAGA